MKALYECWSGLLRNLTLTLCSFFFFKFSPKDRLGRGEREKNRNIDVRNTDLLPSMCAPTGIESTTQVCTLPGSQTINLSVYRMTLN